MILCVRTGQGESVCVMKTKAVSAGKECTTNWKGKRVRKQGPKNLRKEFLFNDTYKGKKSLEEDQGVNSSNSSERPKNYKST